MSEGGERMRIRASAMWGPLLLGLLLAGCPKQIPQAEIDAAAEAVKALDQLEDCAPETTQAARTTMERARALLKEERYEEAKTAFIAARKLVDKARAECEEKKAQAEREAAERAEREAQQAAREAEAPAAEPTGGPDSLQTVYFGFNNSDLTDEAREALADNAAYIRQRPDIRVQIEGHCDERGSTEYNLALGERRALAVKRYLVTLGVEPDKLEIISYGEERPANPAQTDAAHAENRRTEFRELSR